MWNSPINKNKKKLSYFQWTEISVLLVEEIYAEIYGIISENWKQIKHITQFVYNFVIFDGQRLTSAAIADCRLQYNQETKSILPISFHTLKLISIQVHQN